MMYKMIGIRTAGRLALTAALLLSLLAVIAPRQALAGTPWTANIPVQDPTVQGGLSAQASLAERFRSGQSGNTMTRLRNRRNSGYADASPFDSLNLNISRVSTKRRLPGLDALTDLETNSIALSSDALASLQPAAGDACTSTPWGLWGEGFVNVGSEDKNVDNDYTTYGFTCGLDYALTNSFLVGIGLGYGDDKTDTDNLDSRSKANAYTTALYASFLPTETLYLDAALGYNRLDFDLIRRTAIGYANGDRGGNQYFGSLALGYDFRPGRLLVSPYVRLDAAHTRLDSFSESGAGIRSLHYDTTGIDMLATSLGFRSEYTIPTGWGSLIPGFGLEYTHNFEDTGDTNLGYAAQGNLPYRLSMTSLARNSASPTLGMTARFANDFHVTAEYRGTFAEKSRDDVFSLLLGWEW